MKDGYAQVADSNKKNLILNIICTIEYLPNQKQVFVQIWPNTVKYWDRQINKCEIVLFENCYLCCTYSNK